MPLANSKRARAVLIIPLLVAFVAAAAVPPKRQTLHGHVPSAASRLQPLGRLPGPKRLELAIGLPLRNQVALSNLLAELYDPKHPNFHRFLTPEQFVAQFGPGEENYEAVAEFAESHGLSITARHPNRLLLDISGTVAELERALHVNLRLYQHPTEARTFYAPDTEPSLDLATPVLGISGLDNFELPRPMARKAVPFERSRPTPYSTGTGPRGTLLGKDFRNAYASGVSLDGTGEAVGLFEMDGYYAADITAYDSLAGLPFVPLTNVLLNSYSGAAGQHNDEVALDIEMAVAMAPGLSRVIVYEGTVANDILNRMATDNQARQLSSSWAMSPRVDATREQIFMQMAAQGQSMFQASGDFGAWPIAISAPSDDPFVISVGGTSVTTSTNSGAWISETTWPESGGGISSSYPIPTWQQGVSMAGNQGSTTNRNIPDVACAADGIWLIANNGEFLISGGTSAAAPLWAGFAALANQQGAMSGQPGLGFLNPAIYSIGKELNYTNSFHDITTGNNTNNSVPNKFFATNGYDLCTGWGTPNGSNLIFALLAPPNALRITPASGITFSGPAGGPLLPPNQSFTLTNAGSLPVSWTLANTSAWLSASVTNGSVSPVGPSTAVTLSLNSAASNLVAGSYGATVWFTNLNDQSTLSRSFTLAVVTPPIITTQPASQVAMEGATALFFVTTATNALLFYQWRQDNGALVTDLADGGNISGASTSTLTITNLNSNNVGVYSVVVSNAAGTIISSNASLTLLPWRPTITWQPANQALLPGETLNLNVGAVGSQPLSYRWRKEGTNLSDGGKISGAGTSSLTLANIWPPDAGNYSVVMTNSFGSITSAVAVVTVGSLNAPGVTLDSIYSFTDGNDGSRPNGLVQATNRLFYGTTRSGGANGVGTTFQMSLAGNVTPLYSFTGTSDGAVPYCTLLPSANGSFYGTTFRGGLFDNGAVFKMSSNGAVTTLVSLNITNGDFPYAGLALGPDVNSYGVTYKGGAGFGTVFRLATNGAVMTLYSFTGGNDGSFPYGSLMAGSDGNLYGTTFKGGVSGIGTAFKITTNGLLTSLASFSGTNGAFPYSGLAQAKDGNFYGTTSSGGSYTNGTIYRVSPEGVFTNLYSFTGGSDGAAPYATLLAASDGNLYGTTAYGGTFGAGTVFRISPGGNFATLAQFDGFNGANPAAALAQTADGSLYGTTLNGGPGGLGNIFRVTVTGQPQITAQPADQFVFAGANVMFAPAVSGSLVLFYQWRKGGTNLTDGGNIFGANSRVLSLTNVTPANAGLYSVIISNAVGAVQSAEAILAVTVSPPVITLQPTNQTMAPGGVVKLAVSAAGNLPLSFQWQTNGVRLVDGGNISGSATSFLLITNATEANNGTYYAIVSNELGSASSTGAVVSVTPVSIPGTALTALHWFGPDVGGSPPSALSRASNGLLYGTTMLGGVRGAGTIFSLATNGFYTSLASFRFTNGASPLAPVIEGADGDFYGVTYQGGAFGDGVVFKFSSDGTISNLYSFTGAGDGRNPMAGLVQGTDGLFYGATLGQGGLPGRLFAISPGGVFTILHSFTGGLDGTAAAGALFQAADGNLYGLSPGGGARSAGNVFRLNPNGAFTTLYSFTGPDGYAPAGSLVQGADGNLYGVTTYAVFFGLQFNGTIFKITTNGALSTVYTLNSGDGAYPSAGLLAASDGNFYGTTVFGGASNKGTIFRVAPNGAFTRLADLDGLDLGAYPRAAMVEGPDGAFYGTTGSGGPAGHGTVFRLSITGPPQLTMQPANVAALPGANVSFSAAISGSPPLFYHWQKDGTNLTDFGNITGSAKLILTLTNVTTANVGAYSLFVSNSLGFTNSSGAMLTIIPVPGFQTVAKTNNLVQMTWLAVAGQKYRLQFRSNLVSGNWNNLENLITATGSVVTASDTIGSNVQRFYRVMLVP